MENWNIFAPRTEGDDVLRTTVLSNSRADFNKRQLPLGKKSRHTVVIYSGGGGFLANLQMIQETFLKKWANNTDLTIFQLYYGLSPQRRFPEPVVDLLNMYLQIVWYYKLVMGIHDLRVILMGDSAGGCIMLSMLNILARFELEIPVEVIAIYPPVDMRLGRFTLSMLLSLEDQLLYFTTAKACNLCYAPQTPTAYNDWLLSPGLAPDEVLARYPKTYFICGEKDSLKDDIVRMAYRLHSLGKDTTMMQVEGVYHGFLGFQLPLGLGMNEVDAIHDLLQKELERAILVD